MNIQFFPNVFLATYPDTNNKWDKIVLFNTHCGIVYIFCLALFGFGWRGCLIINNNNNIQHLYSAFIILYSNALLWILQVNSDFKLSGVYRWTYVIIIQVHTYNYMQTHIDTMHTYDRHDDITQLKQPEATIINVN